MTLSIVILAAGQGKRMHSELPKVLHRLAGKPLLEHVLDTAMTLTAVPPIIVFGHKGNIVRHSLAATNAVWIEQSAQLGTGHALQQALPHIPNDHRVLVLYGDVPLISETTLKQLLATTPASALGIITATFTNPFGLGRIIRNQQNKIIDIIEEKDATPEQQRITEINSGIYLMPAAKLAGWLAKLDNHNSQKEYYLTRIISMAVQDNIPIYDLQTMHYQEVLGVNDRVQLNQLERYYQLRYAENLMRNHGVTLADPHRIDIRGELTTGRDVFIDVNVIIEGHVKIGNHCSIGPQCVLRNTILGDHVEIRANSVVDGAEIADNCTVGPFARIRPGTILAPHAHVGNFVEIKNSVIDSDTKINHLSYIGDSEIGKRVNIGAGVITCNYDGLNKHRTVIDDDAFIGSNSQLVAPVTIGQGATIGAGSTVTRDAPPQQLTVCRAEQRTIKNWQRPKKKMKES